MRSIWIIFILCSYAIAQPQGATVNFNHLERLTESIRLGSDTVSIVHIYADYPSYRWVDAGVEGIACVDDAARAAVAYLRYFELTHDRRSLTRATSLLKFILHMQGANGQFYNFINADHSLNMDGSTSYLSLGWWSARAVWALSTGYRVLNNVDGDFANTLRASVRRTFPSVDSLMASYGKTRDIDGYPLPRWLLYESGSDATTELVLGLVEYYRAEPDTAVRSYIEKLCEGMMVMQEGSIGKYPYGLHRSWETMWHAWGNGQTQALAEAGRALGNTRMIASAEREADGFYSLLLVKGFLREFDVHDSSKVREFEQIAYDIRPMAVGLLRLYGATGTERYLTMARIAASWFFGNNPAHAVMYDSSTGRCYDGIHSSAEYSRNSGAESTIEALNVMIELQPYVEGKGDWPYLKKLTRQTARVTAGYYNGGSGSAAIVIDNEKGEVSVVKDISEMEFNALVR